MPNGERKILNHAWRGTIGVLLGLLAFLGGWLFTEVSAMPKTYSTKKEVREIEVDNDKEHQAIRDSIDEGFKETQRIILDLHKK